MKLSDQERHILAILELSADAPVTRIAKQTGLRAHTIHYATHKLEQSGIIRRVPFINMPALGYQDYALYFSLAALDKTKRESLISTLVASPFITFLGEFGGDLQYGLAVYARTVTEFLEFLDAISEKFADVFFHKSFSIRISLTRFSRQYLYPDLLRVALTSQLTKNPVVIDDTDHKILSAISAQPNLSHRELAEKIRIPFSTFHARTKALEQSGVLGGYTYFVDTKKIGYQMFELLVYAKGLNRELREQLYNFARAHSHTTYFVHCVGEWDFEIGLEVMDPLEANSFVQQIYETFGADIQTVKILPMFRYLKYGFYRS